MTTMDTNATTDSSTLKDSHRDCFACGGCNVHGLKLHFEVDENGVAAADWQPSGEFLSYADRVHGGIIATLLDSSMVHALFAQGVAGVTADLTIRYLQGVNIDDPIHVSGWVESTRLGIHLCRAEVRQVGNLVVRASAKFVAMPDPPAYSHAE
jgi:acyl-coenzyme A thioesterase PaaI-like protein